MRHPNHALAEQLASAGWRPPQLVAAVNALLGNDYLSRSTVSEWLHAGRVPREPLPAIVTQLLNEATGRSLLVSDLWPQAGLAPAWAVPADNGLDAIANSPSPAVALAADWIRHADRQQGCDRRRFTPVPPSALPSAPPICEAPAGPWTAIALAVTEQIACLPPGPTALRFAHRQTITFAETLTDTAQDSDTAMALARILTTAGNLARIAGAGGLAQRYHASSAILSSRTLSRDGT
jgi:hypothetical protein